MSDDRLASVDARSNQALDIMREEPSALAVSTAWALGYHQGRLELLRAIGAVRPVAYRNDAASGEDWVAAIPLEKLRRVIEETTPLVEGKP